MSKKFFTAILCLFFSAAMSFAQIPEYKIKNNSMLAYRFEEIETGAQFFWNDFVYPFYEAGEPDLIVNIPSDWNKYDLPEDARQFTKKGKGSGTYRLVVSNLKPNTRYSIPVLNICYTAFKIFADEKMIFVSGNPCVKWERTTPKLEFDYATFTTNETGKVMLTFLVSNDFYRKGGFRNSLKIMEADAALDYHLKQILIYCVLCGILITTIIYGVLLFIFKKEKANLYLSLFCFSILLRIEFSIFPLVKYLFPDFPISLMFKLEYIAVFMAPALYTLYVSALNKNIFKHVRPEYILIPSFIFLILDFSLPIEYANRLVPYMQYYMFAVILLDIVLLVIRIVKDKDFVSISAISTVVIIGLGALTDILIRNQLTFLSEISLLPFAFVVYAISQIVLLAYLQNQNMEKLVKLNEHLTETNKAYYRFVPREFLDLLSKKDITEVQVGECKVSKMAILSADIRNFTAISETMSEMQVFDMLNSYLKVVAPVIRKYDGIIEKYLGDGIIAIFPNSAEKALLCSIEMQEKMVELREEFMNRGFPMIRIGVGVHYGNIIIGTGGNEKRMTEISLSNDIDIAVRTEAATKTYRRPIIVTRQVLQSAANEAKMENRQFAFCGKEILDDETKTLFYIYNAKTGTDL